MQGFGKESVGKTHLENPRLKGRILFVWVLRMWNGDAWIGLYGSE
jgi:hypothetical protein